MEIEDLRKVLLVCHSTSIQRSASTLNMTPGALSKTLKRVENSLGVTLFDRVNNTLQVNENGRMFIRFATGLVADFDQFATLFTPLKPQHCIVTGPAIITDYWMNTIVAADSQQQCSFTIRQAFEGEAVNRLQNDFTHFALVTAEAETQMPAECVSIRLGECRFQLAVAPKMAQLAGDDHNVLMNKPFVTPATSVFCGRERGRGSDGWPDMTHPRQIRFRADTCQAIVKLVKQQQAVAFLPDYVIEAEQLAGFDIPGIEQREELYALWRPGLAGGWLYQLATSLAEHG